MDFKRTLISTSLIIGLFISSANATIHNHAQSSYPLENVVISPWAKDEMAEVADLEISLLIDTSLPEKLSLPIDRYSFCLYAARLIAFQQCCDEKDFINTVLYYYAEKDQMGQPIPVFADVRTGRYSAMYYLGVIEGRGDGIFDPFANITRQEAAVLLARTYQAYGGTLPEISDGIVFSDESTIAGWAKESVTAMSAMGIMNGYENGRFAPNDLFSYEQCLTTLARLYKNLPVSRKNGNVTPLFTYEQYITCIGAAGQSTKGNDGSPYEKLRVDGTIATFVETRTTGAMNTAVSPKFVYYFGAMKSIDDLGVCDTGLGFLSPVTPIENPHFSKDGKIFYCTITLEEDIEDYSAYYPDSPRHGHEAGTYQISIDVETCKAKAIKQ